MDYLDPRKRRNYNIRLIIGYVLVAIVIGLATVIIVYGTNGYGINTKTGQIFQNALLFADSNPGGAEIYINGVDRHAATPSRLVLPAGNYSLKLTKAGYRDWNRQFALNEFSVARYVYPFLFPVKPAVTNLKTYTSNPGLFTESPDRRWLLTQINESSLAAPVFDEYDTGTLDQTTPVVQQITLPVAILTGYSSTSVFKEVEWSTDNDHLLLEHTFAGGNEFIVFSRAHPDQSFNVNRLFNIVPTEVSFFDKKAGQLYLYNQTEGTLQLGNTGTKTLGSVLLKHVLAYKTYGRDLITYVSDSNEPVGKVAAHIWNNGQIYKLNEFNAGSKYLIDFAQFQSHFYYIAGSDTSDHINVYKDPLDSIKNPALARAVALLALHNPGADKVGFSDNARFIELENQQSFSVYDMETDSVYQYSIPQVLVEDMAWMDGHRLIGQSGGKVFVMDYDSTNKQLLTPTIKGFGALFSRNYKHMLTLTSAPDGTSVILQDVDLRAGSDLPKKG